MNALTTIVPLVVFAAAILLMVRFRLRAWLAVLVLGLLVGALQTFRTFFLLPSGGGAVLLPAAALLVYYGAFGLCLGAIAEFIRYLHRLTHGRPPKKDDNVSP